MSDTIRAGVIGAGVFGGFHARQYAQIDGVTLAAVLDPDDERAVTLAGGYGATAYDQLDAFLAAVDVVTIASPAFLHGEQALAALKAGKPVYVEKPVATDLAAADRIVQAAAKAGLVAACGHQERVVFQAMGLLDVPEAPLRLEAVRRNMPPSRILDVSVVLDLMIHDIDLALALARGRPMTVEAETGGPGLDTVRAEANFDDGFTAVFEASRVAAERERTMRVVYPSGEVRIDFIQRTFTNTTPFALNPDFADTPAAKNPLGVSVRAFVDAVRGASPRPLATVEEAALALDLALAVEQAAGG